MNSKAKIPVNIVVFGDSISVGDGVWPHKTWVSLLSRRLEKWGATCRKIRLANSSVSGDTTRTALARMAYHVKDKNYDIMLIQFGMNDCNLWDSEGYVRVSKQAFRENLTEIVDRARVYGVSQLLFLTNPPSNKSAGYRLRLRDYNDRIRFVSVSNVGSKIMDIEAAMLSGIPTRKNKGKYILRDIYEVEDAAVSKYLLSDRVHLNEKGHQLYANRIFPVLCKMILKASQ